MRVILLIVSFLLLYLQYKAYTNNSSQLVFHRLPEVSTIGLGDWLGAFIGYNAFGIAGLILLSIILRKYLSTNKIVMSENEGVNHINESDIESIEHGINDKKKVDSTHLFRLMQTDDDDENSLSN
jgi:hypothetical protein